jgi:hypothetical protein
MVGVRAWVHAVELSLVLFAIAAASVLTLRLVLGIAQAQAPERYELLGITPKGGDVAAYVVTYLIPFLDVRFDDLAQMLSLLVLFVSIGLVYVNSNLIYVNPVLSALGFHLYEVELATHLRLALLSTNGALQPSSVWAASLGPHVLLEKKV